MAQKFKPIIVTVADDMLANIHQVANSLAAEGMKVERVMPITGVIAGSCSSGKVSALEKVEGVMSVEEEAVAELPPPDSPTQ
jgi:hypothetical protein